MAERKGGCAAWLIGLPLVILGFLVYYVWPRLKRLHLFVGPRERRVRKCLHELEHGEGWPRLLAAEILGQLREPRAVPLLVATLGTEDGDEAITALVSIGDDAVAPLIQAARATGEGRRRALVALSRLGAGVSDDILMEGLFGAGSLVSETLEIVRRTRPSSLIATLLPRLSDPDWEIRCRAVKVLAAIGGPESVAAVRPMLRDEDSLVRATVIHALDALKPADIGETMLRVVRGEDEEEGLRVEAAMALGRAEGPESLVRLTRTEPSLGEILALAIEYLSHEARPTGSSQSASAER